MTAQEMWLHRVRPAAGPGRLNAGNGAAGRGPSRHAGRPNLVELGLDRDILAAARFDRFTIVPELDPATFRINLV